MPTTFNVISLGTAASIDPTEGNNTAEDAAILVGQTFGGPGNPLANDIASLSPVGPGFSGGTTTAYDMNNTVSNDTFSINGGPAQTFDGTAIYNATITYVDGTTATVTAVLFQDTNFNLYLAPEFEANADQAAYEAAPIQSLTLDSLFGNVYSGLNGTRVTSNFVTCFTTGARIDTCHGPVRVQDLRVGDLVRTQDHGFQPIRWIGRATHVALGNLIPVRIAAGALGRGLPSRDLIVSPQHRLLVRSRIAQRISGAGEVLVAARKLIGLPGIDLALDMVTVTYFHLLLDRHEIIHAEDAPTESLMTGPMATLLMGPDAVAEVQAIFPALIASASQPARPILRGKDTRALVVRHGKNAQPLLQH